MCRMCVHVEGPTLLGSGMKAFSVLMLWRRLQARCANSPAANCALARVRGAMAGGCSVAGIA